MKLWTFYYINKDMLNKDGVYETGYDLFAFTNNKEYALMFIETRDASKFIIRKHKVTKEEYTAYANEHLGKKLDLYKVSIRDNGKHTTEGVIPVDILMTYDEHAYIDEPAFVVEDPGFWDGAAFPFVFKDKYVKALDGFEYVKLFKFFKNMFDMDPVYTQFLNENEDDYEAPDFTLDPFTLLLDVSNDTF